MKKLILAFIAAAWMSAVGAADGEGDTAILAEPDSSVATPQSKDVRVAITKRAGISLGDRVDDGQNRGSPADGDSPIVLELTPALQQALTKPLINATRQETINAVVTQSPPTTRSIQLDPPRVKVVNKTDKFVFRVVED